MKNFTTFQKLFNKSNILLMGLPGSGKTTISKILAKKLNMDVIDVDDDQLEKDWNTTVANKLKELGDEEFIKAEGLSTMKINKNNTIISLTGSNPLFTPAMNYLKQNGLCIYLDINKECIIDRLHKMKVDRIVGQTTKTLSNILDYRLTIYEQFYDLRIIISKNETIEESSEKIISLINKNEEYISTRGKTNTYRFDEVIREGLADDGGLFVPKFLPKFSKKEWERLIDLNYQQR